MIPLVILVGTAIGRWWIVPGAALLWPIAAVGWGDIDTVGGAIAAAILGGSNAALGAIAGTAIRNVAGGLWAAADAR